MYGWLERMAYSEIDCDFFGPRIYENDFHFIIGDLNNLAASKEDFEKARSAIEDEATEVISTVIRELKDQIENSVNNENVTVELIENKRQGLVDKALKCLGELEKKILQEKIVLTPQAFHCLCKPVEDEIDALAKMVYN